MKIAIFESIVTPAGHEHDFDKMLVTELQKAGHEVEFFVPENYPFKLDYGVKVRHLVGEAVTYAGASGLGKALLAGKRELRRLRWFDQLHEYARAGLFDALIIPTATYRFLRTLRISGLRRSPVPVLPLIHGVNAGEAASFIKQVKALSDCRKIRIGVITLSEDAFGERLPNIHCYKPPIFPPAVSCHEPTGEELILGFFGQYRREKNLDSFLQVYFDCRFETPVKLFVQGATVLPEDAEDFRRIQRQYENKAGVEFLHKALIGDEWHKAIAGTTALIMPYSSERYRYHWSAMLFTAIGFAKPVIVADTINPEVLRDYDIGVAFSPQDQSALKAALERFVNTYAAKREVYRQELDRAHRDFAPGRFVRGLLELI